MSFEKFPNAGATRETKANNSDYVGAGLGDDWTAFADSVSSVKKEKSIDDSIGAGLGDEWAKFAAGVEKADLKKTTTEQLVTSDKLDAQKTPSLSRLRSLLLNINGVDITGYDQYTKKAGPSLVTAALLEAGYSFAEADKLEQTIFNPKILNGNIDDAYRRSYVQNKLREIYNDAMKRISGNGETVAAEASEPVSIAESVTPAVEVSVPVEAEEQAPDPVPEGSTPMVVDHMDVGPEDKVERLTISEIKSKYDALIEQDYDFDHFLAFVMQVHTSLKDSHDEVILAANAKLKISTDYTPLPAEKEALKALSGMRADYVKMGPERQMLMEALEQPNDNIDIDRLKDSLKLFVDKVVLVQQKIENLTTQIKSVETQKGDSRLAETYRQAFSLAKNKAEKLLQHIPSSHPLRSRLEAVLADATNLNQSADRNSVSGSDLLEQSGLYIARRDRILGLLGYIEKDLELDSHIESAKSIAQSRIDYLRSVDDSTKTDVQKSMEVKADELLTICSERPVFDDVRLNDTSISAMQFYVDKLEKYKDTLLSTKTEMEAYAESIGISKEKVKSSPFASESLPRAASLIAERLKNFFTRKNEASSESSGRARSIVASLGVRQMGMLSQKLGRVLALAASITAITPETIGQDNVEGLSVASNMSGFSYNFTQIGASATDRLAITKYLQQPGTTYIKMFDDVPKQVDLHKAKILTEVVPGVILGDSIVEQPVPSSTFFSTMANQTPNETGVVFSSVDMNEVLTPYIIQVGDTFWDINEGQTIAGKLPVMKQIPAEYHQAVIDLLRDKINNERDLRQSIGGFGDNADTIYAGESMKLSRLNDTLAEVAINNGFLK